MQKLIYLSLVYSRTCIFHDNLCGKNTFWDDRNSSKKFTAPSTHRNENRYFISWKIRLRSCYLVLVMVSSLNSFPTSVLSLLLSLPCGEGILKLLWFIQLTTVEEVFPESSGLNGVLAARKYLADNRDWSWVRAFPVNESFYIRYKTILSNSMILIPDTSKGSSPNFANVMRIYAS